MSFFIDDTDLRAGCLSCPLRPLSGISPQVRGETGAQKAEDIRLVFVGEAPGEAEATQGRPFVGPAGSILRAAMLELLIPTRAVYITNTCKCRPPDNRVPTDQERNLCGSYLERELRVFPNALIVALGATAASQLLGRKVAIAREHGQIFTSKYGKVFVAYHPAAVLYNPSVRPTLLDDISRAWRVAKEGEHALPPLPRMLQNNAAVVWFGKYLERVNAETVIPKSVVLDIETMGGFNAYGKEARIVLLGLLPNDPTGGVPILQFTDPGCIMQVCRLLVAEKVNIVGHNIKYDLGWLIAFELLTHKDLAHIAIFDTMVEYAHINESATKSLKSICQTLFNVPDWSQAVKDDKGKMLSIPEIPIDKLLVYNAYDLLFTQMLHAHETNHAHARVDSLMRKGTFVVTGLESAGIKIDLTALATLREETIKDEARLLEILQRSILKPTSTKQLRELLFAKFKLPILAKTDKGNQPKCDKATLRMLLERNIPSTAREFILSLLEYRGKAKLSSTYIDSYYEYLSTQREDQNTIIHPEYWMVRSEYGGTVTGRLSSSNPNFQNQPPIMRRVYTSRFEGGELVAIDLNQAELRMLAVMSKDPGLTSIYAKDEDLHGFVAETVVKPHLDQSLGLDSKQIRRIAKTINFGIAYMVSASGLQRKLKADGVTLSFQDAEDLINSWYTRFRGVDKWQAEIKNQVLTRSEVFSIFGRRRRLPGGSLLTATGREVLRQAVNYPIQSAAADLMTYGIMPSMMRTLIRTNCKSMVILNRHDEIVIDVHPDEKEVVAGLIREVFEDPSLPKGGVGMSYDSWDGYCASINVPVQMKYEVKSFAATIAAEEPVVVEDEEGEDNDE